MRSGDFKGKSSGFGGGVVRVGGFVVKKWTVGAACAVLVLVVIGAVTSLDSSSPAGASSSGGKMASEFEVKFSEAEWKKKLSRQEYHVLREKGTERPGTGQYDSYYPETGFFKCAACGNPLYSARAKFKSGCGWPAFDKHYAGSIKTNVDRTFGMKRVEIVCAKCGGHLGHVFEGEHLTPTNERHCVNSVSVKYDAGAPPKELQEKKIL